MLTIREAAKTLGCSQALVYRLVARREIAHFRIGAPGKRGVIRVEEEDLRAYLGGCRVAAKIPATATTPPPVRLRNLTW